MLISKGNELKLWMNRLQLSIKMQCIFSKIIDISLSMSLGLNNVIHTIVQG